MAAPGSGLNAEILRDLQDAERCRALFDAAGTPVQFWEAYALTAGNREAVRAELRRQASKAGAVDPALAAGLQAVRDGMGPLIQKLRDLLDHVPPPDSDDELQEMTLGFLVVSPSARDAAVRWAADPLKYVKEAGARIRMLRGIVGRYRSTLRSAAPAAEAELPRDETTAGIAAPKDLTAAPGDGHVSLAWTAHEKATSYTLKRRDPGGGPYVPLASSPGPFFTDSGLTNGTTYTYIVRAVTPEGASGNSRPVQATPVGPPEVPENFVAAPANAQVLLTWNAVAGATRYALKRATSAAGPFTTVASPIQPGHADPGLDNGTTYTYVVSAVNAGGEGTATEPVEATPVEPPPAPASLDAVPGEGHVTLTWSAVPEAATYTIKRSALGGVPAPIASAASTTFTDGTVANGTTYTYAVCARNPGGESEPSPEAKTTPIAPPAVPSALEAAPGNAQVTLTWAESSRTTEYVVRRATQPDGPWSEIARPTRASYADTGLKNGTRYFYQVTGLNAGGESLASPQIQTVPVAPPAAPAGPEILPGNGEIRLRWKAAPGATSYRLKRSTTIGGPYSPVASPTGPSFTDKGLKNGTTYSYVVSAVNAGGESPNSAEAHSMPVAPPAAPTAPRAFPGNGQVSLTWSAAAEAESYTVKRATSPEGPFVPVATALTSAFYIDAGLTNGSSYYYVITARNTGGESEDSPVSPSTPVAPPAAPTGLAPAPGNRQIRLTWAPSDRATGYQVFRGDAAEGPFNAVANPSQPAYTDTGLVNGRTYHYAVAAANAGGKSGHSGAVQAAPVEPPAPPTRVEAAPGNREVTLSWNQARGAVRYAIKRSTAPGGPFQTVGGALEPSFADSGVTNGTTYYHIITAINEGGESAASAPVSALPVDPPAAPTRLATCGGNGQIALTWAASGEAASYTLKCAPSPDGPFTPVASGLDNASYTHAGLANGTTCYYIVVAINDGGESPASTAVRSTPIGPPTAPADLKAEPGDAQVAISWSPSPTAASYTLKRADGPRGPFTPLVSGLASPSYLHTGLTNGKPYYYVVSALNAGGESPASSPAEAMPIAPPDVPKALRAAAGDAHVALTWSEAERAARYAIRRATSTDGPFAQIAEPKTPSYTDRTVTNGTTYLYTVVASNAGGESDAAPTVKAEPVGPPGAPADFQARPGNARVSISWKPSPGAATYTVLRASSRGGPFTPIAEGCTASAFADEGLTNGTTYFYTARATNPGGTGPDAPTAEATPVDPPATPKDLKAAPGNGQVSLSWIAAAGATGYAVKRATKPEGPYSVVSSPTGTSYVDRSVSNGTAYCYMLAAVNAGGESPATAHAPAMPVAPPPPPANLVARGGNAGVTLKWTGSPEAAKYRLKRSVQPNGPYVVTATPSSPSFEDTSVTNGTTYYYIVTAVNAGGESLRTRRSSAMPVAPPAAPAWLRAAPGNGQATLTWAGAERATSYAVGRASQPGGPYTTVARPTGSGYTDTGLTNDVAVHYTVIAVNDGGESPRSPEAVATPIPPPVAPATPRAYTGNAQVVLSWEPVPRAAAYCVKRSKKQGGTFATVAPGLTETTFINANLANDAKYYFAISAVNDGGESPNSTVVSATPVAPPTARTGFKARAGNGQVTLAWAASARAKNYVVKRATIPSGPFTPIAKPGKATYTDSAVAGGATYYYVVTAENEGGESPESAVVSCTPKGSGVVRRPITPVAGTLKAAEPVSRTAAPEPAVATADGGGEGAQLFDEDSSTVAVMSPPNESPPRGLPVPGPATLPEGVDLEKLIDLRHVRRLRDVFDGTGQKIDVWEVLCLLANDPTPTRREIETILRQKSEGNGEAFNEGAMVLFDKLIRIRTEHAPFVKRLRAFLESLGLRAMEDETRELSLGFIASAVKSRKRAEEWLEAPDRHRTQATAYMEHAFDIALKYQDAMKSR